MMMIGIKKHYSSTQFHGVNYKLHTPSDRIKRFSLLLESITREDKAMPR